MGRSMSGQANLSLFLPKHALLTVLLTWLGATIGMPIELSLQARLPNQRLNKGLFVRTAHETSSSGRRGPTANVAEHCLMIK